MEGKFNMKYLSSSEIISVILEYMNENIYDYAIMIDGAWGSGKTFFIKNILIPEIDKTDKRKSIYTSLYGLKDANEISNHLLSAITEKRIGKKLAPAIGTLTKVALEGLGTLLGSEKIKESELQNILSPFLDYSEHYFIFDDLERCSMPVNEALGFINFFVEQNQSKVIIVANESEIGTLERQRNLEIKYLLASQNTIDWPHPEKKDSLFFQTSHKKERIFIDVNELRRRNEYLFNENEVYIKIKEKLIGKTIFYKPELNNIVPAIIEKCLISNDESKIIALSNVSAIIDIFNSKDEANIRTLQYALLFFSKTCSLMSKQKSNFDEQIYIETMTEVLLSITRVSLAYKSGVLNYNWGEESEYGKITFDEVLFMRNYFISFKFIHDFIYFAEYDEDRVMIVLSNYMEEKRKSNEYENDPYNYLACYWEMEDDEVNNLIIQIFENLKNHKYHNSLYRRIISLLYVLKSLHIESIPVGCFVSVIQTYIMNGESIQDFREAHISNDNPLFNDYIVCVENLKSIENNFKKDAMLQNINSIFDMEAGWGRKFLEHCHASKQEASLEKGFFCHVNIDNCFETILMSSVKDISDFRRSLASFYNFTNIADYFRADIDNFTALKGFLEKTTFSGKMLNYNISLLLIDIKSILQRLGYIEKHEESTDNL